MPDTPPAPLRVELLIFDLDGTLADTRQDLTDAVNFVLHKFKRKPIDVSTVMSYVGDGMVVLLQRALKNYSNADVDRAKEYFHEYYSRHLLDSTRLYPGISRVLEHFDKKVLAVLSNKPQYYTEIILQRFGIYDRFQMVIGGKVGFERKPSPQAIWHILQETGIPASKAAIIGDTKNDIIAGKQAGIYTCAVTYGFRSTEELQQAHPHFLVDRPAQLMEIFK